MKNNIIAILISGAVIVAVLLSGGGNFPKLSDRYVFKGLSRGDVLFPHDRHYQWGIGCLDCHHRYEKGINTLTHEELLHGSPAVSCFSCHKTERELERSYHSMCVSCHKKMEKAGTKSGPVTCGRCHVKKEK